MQNIFIELLPPWIETGLQPAFYDKESGTVLQQVARMWAKMIELGQAFNTFSEDTTTFVNQFVDDTNATVDEYIDKFVELHDYVHDYFDNLDVQEEINNKLEAMAEDGTLQEIVTDYVRSNVAWTFDTVADMKLAENFIAGSFARTLGYHSVNDGGGALYKISDTGTANEMDVIAVYGGLKAHLIYCGTVYPEMLGAYGDGTHDDSDALQRAINLTNCNLELINGKTYNYATTLTINRRFYNFNGNGATLHYTGSGVGLLVDLSALTSHKRDLTNISNFVLEAPSSTDALKVNYANKAKFDNIKVYDFPANGINIVTGDYECNFNDIWLGCRKASGTVGITGNFGDVEFGNLYGVNVETFIYGKPWGSNNINKIHAWCFNGTIFDDEPAMSEGDYATWYANTKLLKVDSDTTANAWGTVINYINCDTYNTCIDWNSYWENLHINNLYLNASQNLVSYTNDYRSYVHRILIDHLNCGDTVATSISTALASRVPHILFVNDIEYEYVQTQTYTDYNNVTQTIVCRPNNPQWIRLEKPASDLTLVGMKAIAFMPFKFDTSGDIALKRPYVAQSSGNSFIYTSSYGDGITRAYVLIESNGYITADNAHLIPKTSYTV